MSSAPPRLSYDDIYSTFGPTMAERGEEYATEDRVGDTQFDPDTGLLSASVSGNRRYRARVRLAREDTDANLWTIQDAICSCPVGSFCKHSAALCFIGATVLGENDEDGEGEDTPGEERTDQDSFAPWRTVLSELIPAQQPGEEPTELGLGVELFARQPQNSDRSWASRYLQVWQEATPEDIISGHELSIRVRPLRVGARGTWIKGGINWATFEYPTGPVSSHSFYPAQAHALHRINQLYSTTVSGLGSRDLLNLSMVNIPEMWDLIRDAIDTGVELVGLEDLSAVELTDTGTLSLDITTSDSPANPDGLSVVIQPRVAGQPVEAHGTIGTVGFYAVHYSEESDTVSLRMTPVAGQLNHTVTEMLAEQARLEIPAEDISEFFSTYYPKLSSILPVTSPDLDLPEVPDAVLRISVSFGSADTLKLSVRWFYQGAEDQTEHMAEVLTRARHTWPEANAGSFTYTGATAAVMTDRVLPELAALDHIELHTTGDTPDYEELTGETTLSISAVPSAQRDWFDLGFQITIGDVTVPFSKVFIALARGENTVLLPNKTYFTLDHPAFDELKNLIAEATALDEWDPEAPQVSRFSTSVLSYAEEIADTWEADERVTQWLTHLEELKELDVPDAEVPETVQADLRPYQVEGFRWLAQLYALRLGGILADDMGLGKTLQTLALIDHADADAPFLVIAPASVVSVWEAEAARFVPHLTVGVLDAGTTRNAATMAAMVADSDIIVTSYSIARLDSELFTEHTFGGIVLDEAQFVKNHRTKAHQAIREFTAPFWLAITGTPMENSLSDLWSIFNLVAPGVFGSYTAFRETYQKPIEAGQRIAGEGTQQAPGTGTKAAERMSRLRERIKPLMLRRTKDIVADDLPEKQEQTLTVELNPVHRRLYDQVLQRERKKVLKLIGDMDSNRMNVFRSLTLLRMLALDPQIVDDDEYAQVPSSKLTELMSRLEETLADDHRVIVFSQFTSFLHRISEELEERDIRYTYLDGSTRNRGKVIEEFRTEDVPVFLISLKAGGFGLTLTEADYVFLMDPWWNPAAEAQAVDRTHRIGQHRNVMVYRMVAQGTIEEKVVELQKSKADMFSSLTEDDTAFTSTLTTDDILALFSTDSEDVEEGADHTAS